MKGEGRCLVLATFRGTPCIAKKFYINFILPYSVFFYSSDFLLMSYTVCPKSSRTSVTRTILSVPSMWQLSHYLRRTLFHQSCKFHWVSTRVCVTRVEKVTVSTCGSMRNRDGAKSKHQVWCKIGQDDYGNAWNVAENVWGSSAVMNNSLRVVQEV